MLREVVAPQPGASSLLHQAPDFQAGKPLRCSQHPLSSLFSPLPKLLQDLGVLQMLGEPPEWLSGCHGARHAPGIPSSSCRNRWNRAASPGHPEAEARARWPPQTAKSPLFSAQPGRRKHLRPGLGSKWKTSIKNHSWKQPRAPRGSVTPLWPGWPARAPSSRCCCRGRPGCHRSDRDATQGKAGWLQPPPPSPPNHPGGGDQKEGEGWQGLHPPPQNAAARAELAQQLGAARESVWVRVWGSAGG